LTFDLRAILIFGLAALLYAGLLPARWRAWALLAGSVFAIYWLQPALPIRYSGYIFPTVTLILTVAAWWLTRKPGDSAQSVSLREDRVTLAVIAALVVGFSFLRFLDAEFRPIATRPPDPLAVAATLGIVGAAMALVAWLVRKSDQRRVLTVGILLVAALFVVLKTQPLAVEVSRWWRGQTGQDTSLASLIDLNWLGFSYVAFRLIHTLRDRQTGQLPVLSLREYVTYVIFFPAYTAGPIDRAERFVDDLRAISTLCVHSLDAARWALGLRRIVIGLFCKFVLADSLAQGVSLNATNVVQVNSTPWLWVLLYGYALRLFFDFSGYSDIAIGIGILFGIRLPENFDRPYLKTTITAFWQSWHMTLSNWARFHVFSPLSRWWLMREHCPSPTVIVLLAQLATMMTIGLWHGVTVNFVIWGAWHGIALFLHKQWGDRTRKWYRSLNDHPWRKRVWAGLTWFMTFQYVVLGWVWFAVPDTGQAARTLMRLFGLGW
jgi:alginate O-acetyltransferase complex protein AlgI